MVRAFEKLSLRDKITLLILFVAFVLAFAFLLVKVLNRPLMNQKGFPDCTLVRDGSLQSYQIKEYTDLPYIIEYPETDRYVSVGGKEQLPMGDGCGFEYAEDMWIVANVLSDGQTMADVIGDDYYLLATNVRGNKTSYKSVVSGKGYMNSLYAEYESGYVLVNNADVMCALSYAFPLDDGRKTMIGILCADKNRVGDAKQLLDRIFFTYRKPVAGQTVTEPQSEAEAVADQGAADVAVDVSGGVNQAKKNSSFQKDESVSEWTQEQKDWYENFSQMDADEATEYMKTLQGESNYVAKYPDKADYLVSSTVVTQDQSRGTCVFVFDYDRISTTAKECIIQDPAGNEYSPSYVNKYSDGLMLLYVDKPAPGTWQLRTTTNDSYGRYFFSVYTLDGFYEMYPTYAPFKDEEYEANHPDEALQNAQYQTE